MLAERKAMRVEPKPICKSDLLELILLLQKGNLDNDVLLELLAILTNRVPPGVDETSLIKADFFI